MLPSSNQYSNIITKPKQQLSKVFTHFFTMHHTVAASATPMGAGGFGSVHFLKTEPEVAWKVVQNQSEEHRCHLYNEFNMINAVYTARQPKLFRIPAPYAYTHLASEPEVTSSCIDAPRIGLRITELNSSNATYAMERIPSLQTELSSTLLTKVAPQHADKQVVLCRLYFGRDGPVRSSRFFNSRNFPIDADTYELLRTSVDPSLPSKTTVAIEMGRMLASLHTGGFDGRDVEYVLAGASGRSSDIEEQASQLCLYDKSVLARPPATWAFWTFDFNQMRRVSSERSSADSFFLNDPYYPRPRPRPTEPLYEAFKAGYLQMPTPDRMANKFFDEIERRQMLRDQSTAAK